MSEKSGMTGNAKDLSTEINWFLNVLNERLKNRQGGALAHILEQFPAPDFSSGESSYSRLILQNHLSEEERLILLLGLIPHIRPEILDPLLQKNQQTQQEYTEFGGYSGARHQGFLPTGQTVMFLLCGTDLEARFRVQKMLSDSGRLALNRLIWLDLAQPGEPQLSGALMVPDEVVDEVTSGEKRQPKFSAEFPAKRIKTNMGWDDLILDNKTREAVLEIELWIRNGDALMNEAGMCKSLKPGYSALFYGPPGTGKSLTATLLGKRTGKEVYRIDLSKMVSKYIGETEKNLAKVFAQAENKDWILFFDEADALFGKRSSVKDAHDRYANQEVSYLLQRIEDYTGLAVLASNQKNNIDSAFIRRFQSIVHFPMPAAKERQRLWESFFSPIFCFDQEVNLRKIAQDYDLAGGSIINVVAFSSLKALDRGNRLIVKEDLLTGIRREFGKEGRAI